MIDLSNNNGPVNFDTIRHAGHQRRVYLKRSEGVDFVDPDFDNLYRRALNAGLKVGAYHFARPSRNSPHDEAIFFLRLLPRLLPGRTLRPALDLEDPNVKPGPHIGAWAREWMHIVLGALHCNPILYGPTSFIAACDFQKRPGGLWAAAFGRNDGEEHPFIIPHPWTPRTTVAHQYASEAHIAGVAGHVDISRVLHARRLDIHRLQRR